MIREQMREELNLTASAGVAPNKLLAKIASDWNKPDGLFVIQPHEVQSFLLPLPVGRIPGVGKVTETRMKGVGIATVGGLYAMDAAILEHHFGRYGRRLYELARGIDHDPVVPNRLSKSISAEDTFEIDIPLVETEPSSHRIGEQSLLDTIHPYAERPLRPVARIAITPCDIDLLAADFLNGSLEILGLENSMSRHCELGPCQ
jgi:DNA polymerase-4